MAGHTGDRAVVTAALTDPRPEARVAAIGAAVRLGLLDAVGILAFLDDPAPEVRFRAIELTPRVEAPSPTDHAALCQRVIAALEDPALAEVAAFAIGELQPAGPEAEQAVTALGRQATDHDDPLCRESAVAALGALGDGLDHILSATGDIATVRRRAVLALAPFDGPEVDRALQAALADRDWQVRQAAEDLLEPPA